MSRFTDKQKKALVDGASGMSETMMLYRKKRRELWEDALRWQAEYWRKRWSREAKKK